MERALTDADIKRYEADGFVFQLDVLTPGQVAVLGAAIDRYLAREGQAEVYELTDPIAMERLTGDDGTVRYEYRDVDPTDEDVFPFLFNLWSIDDVFRQVANHPVLVDAAKRLLGADELLLFEDNVVVKSPGSPRIPWHQDWAYWPIAEPRAVTAWIAIDGVDETNGAMEMVPGSHSWGERLPVYFGDGSSYMAEDRPHASPVPQELPAGTPVVTYALRPGQCGFHHAMVWHGSRPNETAAPRRALVIRYVVAGTTWLGHQRFPYDPVDCEIGQPLDERAFPAVSAQPLAF